MDQDTAIAAEQRLAIKFVGSGSEYWRIWIVNLLLTLVTLGLYYPFAKVRRLRYFHGATEVGGHPLSFHADPWKMLRGYLLVGVLMVAYSASGYVSRWAGLAAFVIIAMLWPALWHSSLRFRLANTGWRGLRFRFAGTRGGAYAALTPGFVMALPVLALGALMPAADAGGKPAAPASGVLIAAALTPLLMALALPALLWLIRRYQHRHYALAGEQTRFDVRLGAFYGVVLRTAGVSLLVAAVGGAVVALVVMASGGLGGGEASRPDGARALLALLPLVLMVLLMLSVRPYFTSRMQNLVWNGTRSARLQFISGLRFRPLLVLTLKNWALMVLTLGLYFPFAAVATARMRLQAVELRLQGQADDLVATGAAADEAAAGDAAGDMLGLDIGL